MLGACCCGCWGLALLARFRYPRALLALVDGARMTTANLLPTVGLLALLGWAPPALHRRAGWFVYFLLPMALAGGSVTALGMAALIRPAFKKLEQAGRKAPEPIDPFETDPSETDQEDDLP